VTTIRPARDDDYQAYTRLFAEFEIPDPVPTRERFVEQIAPQIHVAVRTGEVVGFISARPYGELVHVVQLAVDRSVRGQRIGEQLLEHVRSLAKAAGCTRWYLNVKRDNAPAIKLYERVGFRFELESVAMKIAWSCIPPHAVHGGLADPAEDAVIASTFELPRERVEMFRTKSTRSRFHLVTLRDPALVGFAAFDPDFPGAATFRTTRPELAADLLEAMRAYARADVDYTHLTVEGDRALVDAVLALGAEVTFEILRLSAPL
jgi:GNAT superfamily N-acetyltransferase